MITFLLSLINPLKSIATEITKLKIEKLKASTSDKKLEYDERIKLLESRRDVILKAQSDPFERWVRIGFAFPFVIYIWKLIIYDKVIMGSWTTGITDDLSLNLWSIAFIILGGYFVDTVVKRFRGY